MDNQSYPVVPTQWTHGTAKTQWRDVDTFWLPSYVCWWGEQLKPPDIQGNNPFLALLLIDLTDPAIPPWHCFVYTQCTGHGHQYEPCPHAVNITFHWHETILVTTVWQQLKHRRYSTRIAYIRHHLLIFSYRTEIGQSQGYIFAWGIMIPIIDSNYWINNIDVHFSFFSLCSINH